MKRFIFLVISILLLVSCGTTSSLSSSYYNISILNDSGKTVYHFPCVKVLSQTSTDDYEEITFRALDGGYYCVRGKQIVLTETTYRTYRRSYFYYDAGPAFRYYPVHYYHNPGPRPIPHHGVRQGPRPAPRHR